MTKNVPALIFVAVLSAIIILISSLGLFSIWLFVGIVILSTMYLFGYLYVVNYYKMLEDIDRKELQNKKKFDWCWTRSNEILKKMIGGQGLSWGSGVGRRSEYRSFHNGIQLCGFRSIEGFLSGSQQLVIIIYDIENDDVVRYYANPSPDIIDDHFFNFKPFQSKESFSGMNQSRYPYNYRSPSRRRPSGMPLYRDNSQYDSLDNFSARSEPSEDIVVDSLKKLKK